MHKPAAPVSPPGNRPWQVETNGINRIPDTARNGRPRDLFWIWFAANIGILAVVYGGVIASFGQNFLQGVLVVLLGSSSFVLVGIFGVAGRDGGAPMMTLSRAVFGIWGNIAPNIVSWASLLGWETITVTLGTFALMALLGPVLPLGTIALALWSMVIMVALTVMAGLLGQATLVLIQTWASAIFGALTLLVIVLLIAGTHWQSLLTERPGPWLDGFVPALSIVVAGTGLSWANAASDYSRYLPRRVRGSRIVWSSALGGGIPLTVLMLTGLLLAGRDPSLAASANPIAALRSALPAWASIPYLIAAAGGLVAEADLSLYSSGLNLLNMFVPWPRYKTVLIDAAIMIAGTVYIVLVARNFFGPFESFVTLLGVGLAAWAGVFLVHQQGRRREGSDRYPDHLVYAPRGARRGAAAVNARALASWAAGVLAGLLFTSSPFVRGPYARGIFATSSLALAFAFGVSGLLFSLLSLRSRRPPVQVDTRIPTCDDGPSRKEKA